MRIQILQYMHAFSSEYFIKDLLKQSNELTYGSVISHILLSNDRLRN